jgi:hypothetical protein
MYKYNKRRVNKGYVLIYVLLVGSLCLLSSIFVFQMEMEKRSSLNLYKDEVTSINKLQKCRENLLTGFDTIVNTNASSKDVPSIKAYLLGLPLSFKIYYQNSYISYNKTNDKIFIDYYLDGIYYKTEYYKYYVDSLKIKYKCSNISYVKGMVN